jgi:PAS domain S-box-containing protein
MNLTDLNDEDILNSLPGIFYLIDSNGRFVIWNRNLERISGYTAEQIAEMNPRDFFEGDDKDYISNKIETVFKYGSATADAYLVTNTNERIPYFFTGLLTSQKGNNYLVGMGIDNSERKKAERAQQQLVQSERNYKHLFENSPLPQWITERGTFRFLKVNQAAISRYGYTEQEFLGMSVLNILPLKEQQRLLVDRTSFPVTEGAFSTSWQHKKKSGQFIYTEVTSILIEYDEREAMLCIINDVTERVKMQETLTSAVINAQERERSQLGQELHDNVNQILTTVKLYNEMCLEGSPAASELLSQSMHYLQVCIDEIRNISKRLSAPTLGSISMKDSIISLISSINVGERLHIRHYIKGLSRFPIDEEFHLTVYRIVQEQLNNILRHAQAKSVTVSVVANSKSLRLQIKDDGKGFNLQSKRNGIGLSNIKSRAEHMKGKMEIITAPGKGCTLHVEFPSNRASA